MLLQHQVSSNRSKLGASSDRLAIVEDPSGHANEVSRDFFKIVLRSSACHF
jgi:hypothetical protein